MRIAENINRRIQQELNHVITMPACLLLAKRKRMNKLIKSITPALGICVLTEARIFKTTTKPYLLRD